MGKIEMRNKPTLTRKDIIKRLHTLGFSEDTTECVEPEYATQYLDRFYIKVWPELDPVYSGSNISWEDMWKHFKREYKVTHIKYMRRMLAKWDAMQEKENSK